MRRRRLRLASFNSGSTPMALRGSPGIAQAQSAVWDATGLFRWVDVLAGIAIPPGPIYTLGGYVLSSGLIGGDGGPRGRFTRCRYHLRLNSVISETATGCWSRWESESLRAWRGK